MELNYFAVFLCFSCAVSCLTLPATPAAKVTAVPPCSTDVGKCVNVTATSAAVCLLDEDVGCIRKFPSECHLLVAHCKAPINFSDYGSIYCDMETFLCELDASYERWTIFFGHEKDV